MLQPTSDVLEPLRRELRAQVQLFESLQEGYPVDKTQVRQKVERGAAAVLPSARGPGDSDLQDEDLTPIPLNSLLGLRKQLSEQIPQNRKFFGEGGATLLAGLDDILKNTCQGPEAVETFIAGTIRDHLESDLNYICQNSKQFALLVESNEQEIHKLTERVKEKSDQLGCDAPVPRRAALEQERHDLVSKLLLEIQRRDEAIVKPSDDPLRLHMSLLRFQEKVDEKLHETQHRGHAHEQRACTSLRAKEQQLAYKEQEVGRCNMEIAQAEQALAEANETLASEVVAVLRHFQAIRQAIREARRNERIMAERTVELQLVDELLTDASQEQERQAARHREIVTRCQDGKDLIEKWQSWIKHSYEWLEGSFTKKRQELLLNLPQEKRKFRALLEELIKDMKRRRAELQWTKEQTRRKHRKAEVEFARLERVPQPSHHRGESTEAQIVMEKMESLRLQYYEIEAVFDTVGTKIKEWERVSHEMADALPVEDAPGPESDPRWWVWQFFFNKAQTSTPALTINEGDPIPSDRRRSWWQVLPFLGRGAPNEEEAGGPAKRRRLGSPTGGSWNPDTRAMEPSSSCSSSAALDKSAGSRQRKALPAPADRS